MESVKLIDFKKIKDGKYLKNYELHYTNKLGHDKTYEIVSYRDLESIDDIGSHVGGVVIAGLHEGKLLLLREFRMGVNRFVYNLCAGRREYGESIEDCAARELYEETGLSLKRIVETFRPAYGALTLSDAANQLVIAELEGEISDHTEEDELIEAGFYDKEQVQRLLEEEPFSSRAQFVAYSFTKGLFDQ